MFKVYNVNTKCYFLASLSDTRITITLGDGTTVYDRLYPTELIYYPCYRHRDGFNATVRNYDEIYAGVIPSVEQYGYETLLQEHGYHIADYWID